MSHFHVVFITHKPRSDFSWLVTEMLIYTIMENRSYTCATQVISKLQMLLFYSRQRNISDETDIELIYLSFSR